MKNNLKIIHIIIAFIMFSYYIWSKFIRMRLPRNIPFDLSLFKLVIICIIIITFILLLKREIKPINSNYREFLQKILSILFKPFYILNNFLQNNNYFRFICKKLFKLFFKVLFSTLNYTKNTVDIRVLFFTWIYIPKILLIIIFYINIFYFHQLFFIYIFALISLMPLLFKYFIYLMKEYEEEYIIFLETWYEVEELDTKELLLDGENDTTIRSFLSMQTISLGFTPYKYKCSLKYELIQKHYPHIKNWSDLNQEQREFLEKDFYDLLPLVENIDYFFSHYNYDATNIIENMKKFQVYLYLLYLIGWIYILSISIHTFHLLPFEETYLENFQDIIEPFSNLILEINNNAVE